MTIFPQKLQKLPKICQKLAKIAKFAKIYLDFPLNYGKFFRRSCKNCQIILVHFTQLHNRRICDPSNQVDTLMRNSPYAVETACKVFYWSFITFCDKMIPAGWHAIIATLHKLIFTLGHSGAQ